MPNAQKFNIWRPSKEEQEIMNRNFERATATEKNKISFVQIDLGELGVFRSELPAESRRQFAYDIINALCEKGITPPRPKDKKSKGRIYANNLLARSLTSLKRSSEGGKNKTSNQTDNNQQQEDFF